MIPAVSINTATLAHISHHNYQVSPLTTDHVIEKSYVIQGSPCNSRFMGYLSWVENEHVASLNSRVDFINKVISSIVEKIPLRDTPIILISLGSGGLLTESFINKKLKNEGYKDISWRIIDPDYQNNGYEQCRKEFRERINNNVMTFTTEQKYLNKSLGHNLLAENDKNRGFVVVLAINPPTDLSGDSSYSPDCMPIRGRPVEDVRKANGIYLLVAQTAYKETLYQIPRILSEGGQIIILDFVLKCSINKQENYKISYSPSKTGIFMSNGTKPYLDSLSKISDHAQKKIELSDVDKAFDQYIENLNNSGKSGIKFFVSDYDTSIENLHDYFIYCNDKSIFASFDKNEISLERK